MSIVRVTFSGVCLGQTMQNVVHFINPDGSMTLPAVCNEMLTYWIQPMVNCHTSSFSWTNIRAEDITSATPAQPATLAIAAAGVGTPTTTHVCLAFIFKWQTGVGGRRGRGRIFVPAPRADWVANSVPTQAGLNYMISNVIFPILQRFGSNPAGTSVLTLCVTPRNLSTPPLGVENIAISPKMGVQRRRNIGVGI